MAKEQNVPGSVKAENTFKRLPSFKSPRDLNLSQFTSPLSETRTKKVFVPNLNIQRRKQNESSESGGSEEHRGTGPQASGKRGRGTARPKREYVQTSGIFSEGLAPQTKTRSGRWSSSDSGATTAPKLKLRQNLKGAELKKSKEEEDLIMEELMRDDFIEGGPQPDLDNCPVHLPLTKLEDLKIEPTKAEIKKIPEISPKNGVKIKSEPGTESTSLPNVNSSETFPIAPEDLRPLNTAQLIAQAHSSDFIFFQIPNSVPRLKVPESAHSKASNQKSQSKNTEDSEADERHSLRTLPPGRIGSLQILRSGRARLLLGDVILQLEPGTQVAFKQDVVSVDLDQEKKSGNMINMGKISTRMLVTPDWASLLAAPPR